MRREEGHQVLVVGGGPAGVSCALECLDVGLDVVLLESASGLGGQLTEVLNSVRNLSSGRFENGEALRRSLVEASEILGERRRTGVRVTRADLGGLWVEAEEIRFSARALVLCTGRRRRRLPFAEEGALGGDVTYLLELRPGHFVGRTAAVVGGGDSAALDALELARTGSRVHLVHRGEALRCRSDIAAAVRAEERIETLPGYEVLDLIGNDRLQGVVAARTGGGGRERRVLEVGGLVIKIGYAPNTEFVAGQLELEAEGAVRVGPDLGTSRRGVFAAGDVVSGSYPRIATAMGQGVLAVRSILEYLHPPGT